MAELQEKKDSLWWLTISPVIWSIHFLLCYITAAIWCAKVAGREGPLGDVLVAIAIYTVIALVGIGITGWHGFRKHSFGTATAPHDFDTREDRHRFIGFATLLLSGLSFVATVYVAIVALFVDTCH